MKSSYVILTIVIVVIGAFIAGQQIYKNSEQQQTAGTEQRTELAIRANDWVMGNPQAKVTLIEYLDFECEACGAYYPIVSQIKEEYKNDIRFVVRYFPLTGHRNSKTAAYAVEAAGKQGKFWELHDVLFSKQKEWGEQRVTNQDQFEKYAIEAGVNLEQWRQDVKSEAVIKRVDDSFKEAQTLGLQGTPSFFLNGRELDPPGGYEAFKQVIETELKK